jgi:hypothetical protein
MKIFNEKMQEVKTEFDKKVLEMTQKGQELGMKILKRAQDLRENLHSEDFRTVLIEKAIVVTDVTRAKLDELAHKTKNQTSKASKRAGKKAASKAEESM